MNAKEQAQARFRQAVLDMRDVVRHGNQDVLGRHTDDALMFGDAYAAACVVEARAPLVEALRDCHALLQDAHYEYDLLGRNFCGPDVAKVIEAAAAALAKETPDA